MARAVTIISCATNISAKPAEAIKTMPARQVMAQDAMAMFLPPTRSVKAPPRRLKIICNTTGTATRVPIWTPDMPSERA
jgi:hypothetical protein